MIRTLMAVPVPTIAAVDGAAVGMGMDLALACDSRFIGTTGWMRQGWARYGAIPATGGLVFLGEHLRWNEPVGALVVLVGVALTQGRLRYVPGRTRPSAAGKP